MTDIHAEHLNALSSLIMPRMIYRRLHNRPELIKQVADSLESEIKALDPDKVAAMRMNGSRCFVIPRN